MKSFELYRSPRITARLISVWALLTPHRYSELPEQIYQAVPQSHSCFESYFISTFISNTPLGMSSSSSPIHRLGGNIDKRRNGLKPACENCRKAKVRCDISMSDSVCSRCKKRKSPCIVLEAPMTKSKPETLTATPQVASPHQMSTIHFFKSPAPVATPSISGSTPTSHTSAFSHASESSGYLGSTSYSSTLQNSELGHPNDNTDDVGLPEQQEFDPRQVALGVHILKHIPYEETANLFLDIYLENTRGLIGIPRPIIRQMVNTMYIAFAPAFEYPWNEEALENTSKCLFQNARKDLSDPEDPNDWVSKDQIRWDFIGLLFIAFAYALLSSHHKKDALVDEAIGHRDRKIMIRETKKCIEGCIDLTRNSLCLRLVNLLYKNLLLETVLEGDASTC